MKAFTGVEEFEKAVGAHLGYSDWHTITQAQIDAELLDVTRGANGARATVRVIVEREGSDKPACVAETVLLVVA
ncbi:hypothetical protein [Microtetraspora sp. NBRC 16547]|uniref:hypothetical protein n=1 Tax=Microtetraspora sp. NBRC 16547 TaxID=3030993 RepID=UPI0024A10951|nr:hypothetical protein [Microtetraspora sp. NBRC 16547]GLW99379.1 hypothetical protein Misp02_34660 [Microtetraspora sp. NBRC 16547]